MMSATDKPMDEKREWTLSAADAAALDAALNGEAGIVEEGRRARVAEWLEVVGSAPVPEARGDLAERTLRAVTADRMQLAATVSYSSGGRKPAAGFSSARRQWRRFSAEIGAMAVAASLLAVVTVLGLGQAKRADSRAVCFGNLENVRNAVASYAQDFSGELPMLARPANGNWLRGSGDGPRDNAANLLPLVTAGYVKTQCLACGGAGAPQGMVVAGHNELVGIGYSYRNVYGSAPARWDGARDTIVMADKNPVFAGGRTSVQRGVEQRNSDNHEGYGNYVLRANGEVSWETTPNCGAGRDNIWTVGAGGGRVLSYTGTETPRTAADTFVCP